MIVWICAGIAGGVCLLSVLFYELGKLFVKRRKRNRAFCRECKSPFFYKQDVAWKVQRTFSVLKKKNDLVKSVVLVECICSRCGNLQNYCKTYVIGKVRYQADGKSKLAAYDISSIVEQDFLP